MSLKSIVKDFKGILFRDDHARRRGRSHIAPEGGGGGGGDDELPPPAKPDASSLINEEGSAWANLPLELLRNIIERVEATETTWPGRRDVVACALVCKTWREITKNVVKTPELCGCLTFPISLKQPGPRDTPIQCFIRRERASSTYHLYIGLSPALSGDTSKLLLAAKKMRRARSTDFRISFTGSNFCQTGSSYVGKLRSNFLGTKFTIYDSLSPYPVVHSTCKSNGNLSSVQSSPHVPARNYEIATIRYELNIFRTRGPRRMNCIMHTIPFSAIQAGGSAPTPVEFKSGLDEQCHWHSKLAISKVKQPLIGSLLTNLSEPIESTCPKKDPLVLRNKAPRWHEQLQCWCLNFKGRVTVASVKNFQLVAAIDPSQDVSVEEQEKVILQFGKIGKDIFTMDYRYPLSAFQAFAICLSSFDTKPACE